MENITGKICILFLYMLLTSMLVCEPKKYHNQIYKFNEPSNSLSGIINNISDAINVIKENSILTAKMEKKVHHTLNIMKENSIAVAKLANNACPSLYERVTKACN
ncbi:unnamed protein product, partial [Meganyctiphanes norvegica]